MEEVNSFLDDKEEYLHLSGEDYELVVYEEDGYNGFERESGELQATSVDAARLRDGGTRIVQTDTETVVIPPPEKEERSKIDRDKGYEDITLRDTPYRTKSGVVLWQELHSSKLRGDTDDSSKNFVNMNDREIASAESLEVERYIPL